jgi:hypothetical protein
MHANWSEVAEAPRNSAQRLWDRFARPRTSFARCRYFQKMRQERAAGLEAKAALVRKPVAGQLDGLGQDDRAIQELQKAWQASAGSARCGPRYAAIRTASAFFTRRREDRHAQKTWSTISRRRGAVRAGETLAGSTSGMRRRASEAPAAQGENVGPIRRNKSEEMWNRFRAAGDKFFEQYTTAIEIAGEQAGGARGDGRRSGRMAAANRAAQATIWPRASAVCAT